MKKLLAVLLSTFLALLLLAQDSLSTTRWGVGVSFEWGFSRVQHPDLTFERTFDYSHIPQFNAGVMVSRSLPMKGLEAQGGVYYTGQGFQVTMEAYPFDSEHHYWENSHYLRIPVSIAYSLWRFQLMFGVQGSYFLHRKSEVDFAARERHYNPNFYRTNKPILSRWNAGYECSLGWQVGEAKKPRGRIALYFRNDWPLVSPLNSYVGIIHYGLRATLE